MASESRNRDARARAEEALVRFALLTADHAMDFVVIGGLNPDFLAPDAPKPHLGTTDVDLLFELGFVYDRDELDFAWLDQALAAGGFTAVKGVGGWRWSGQLGDANVRLDLLCDVHDSPGQPIHLPGAIEASAQNLPGPAIALRDPIERELQVPESVRNDAPDAPHSVKLRFASLGGYIAAKSAAFTTRQQAKDAYDLAFVIMYAPGGPRAAAAATTAAEQSPSQDSSNSAVEPAVKRLANPTSHWIGVVVEQLQTAGDDSDEDRLRADILASATQFLNHYANT